MERFWSKVEIGDPAECWDWRAGVNKGGYGVFEVGTSQRHQSASAHRVAWEVTAEEPVPPGLFVCHRCDNPRCCNPRHLFLGTPRENTRDMIAKGRRVAPSTANRARGDRHPSKLRPGYLPTGEAHPAAKLTEADVVEIRRSSALGTELAARFGVSNVSISRIRRRLTWRHVA